MEAIIYIGLLACTWLFVTGASSLQFLKKLVKLDNESSVKSLTWSVIRELVNCAMCSGFWIGLVYYLLNGYHHYFLYACLVSVGAEIFARIVNLIFNSWLNKL